MLRTITTPYPPLSLKGSFYRLPAEELDDGRIRLRERGAAGLIYPLIFGAPMLLVGGYFLWGELNSKAPAIKWVIGSSITAGLGLLVVLLAVPLALRFREAVFDPGSGEFTYRRRMLLTTRRSQVTAEGRLHHVGVRHGGGHIAARIYFPSGAITVAACRSEEEALAYADELSELLGIDWIWGTPIIDGYDPAWSRVERDIHSGRKYRSVEQVPRDTDLYLRCLECDGVVPTLPVADESCACRNIVIEGVADQEVDGEVELEVGRMSVSNLYRVELVRDPRNVVRERVAEEAADGLGNAVGQRS